MALAGGPEWSAVMALDQTCGRGRAGHTWVSPPGKNLALSLILRPPLTPEKAPILSLLAAVATANILESKGVAPVGLKWPNDVLVGGRKIAGILLEALVERDRIQHVIVGLGLNVNSRQDDFPQDFPIPATSYLICTGKKWDIEDAARTFLGELKSLYNSLETRGLDFVIQRWQDKWLHKNHSMVHEGKTGRAVGVSAEGFLVMAMPDGSFETVTAGDVVPLQAS
jgi:BirA family biotin operon repressor/biotin-[acetyl-CoA-carboxylase] ligase